ncbi:MAG: M20/M25/M40 family metallo-hydrolase [Thermoplasmatota archaeon]
MDEAVDLLKDMVSIPSVTGSTEDAVDLLMNKCCSWGMETIIDRGALIVNPSARKLLLLGHIDTVPAGPPVRIKNGELWGRGSVDAKGPLCSAVSALRDVPDLWDNVMLMAVPDEEGGSETAYRLRDEIEEMPVVILEPSGAEGITISYNGRLLVRLEAIAEKSHSGHGVPFATEKVISLLNEINGILGPRILEFGGGMEKAYMLLDIRYPKGTKPELPEAEKGVKIEMIEDVKPYRSDKSSMLVRSFMRAIRSTGGRPVFKKKTGTSDMNIIGERWSSPMIAYGPGDGRMDHTDEERMNIDEYLQGIEVLKHAIRDLADL